MDTLSIFETPVSPRLHLAMETGGCGHGHLVCLRSPVAHLVRKTGTYTSVTCHALSTVHGPSGQEELEDLWH